MTASKPRRRWLQFRLKTLLLVTAVLCVPLAWVGVRMNDKRKERAVIAELERLGGIVEYDYGGVFGACQITPLARESIYRRLAALLGLLSNLDRVINKRRDTDKHRRQLPKRREHFPVHRRNIISWASS